MKKFIALLLSIFMVLSLAGCTQTTTEEETAEETTTTEETTVEEETTEEETTKASYMLGVAAVPKSYSQALKAEMETSLMAVIFDMDGKIMDISFDVTEQIVEFAEDGTVSKEAVLQTKAEQGDAYGMKDYSPIGKEFYEQIESFKAWAIGKTVDEAMNMSEDEDLKSGVTIATADYFENLKKAYDNAMPLAEMPADVALGVSNLVVPQEGDGAEKGASVEITATFVGLATNADGKIIGIMFDAAQQKINFDVAGELTGEIDLRTKVEKGPDYNMIIASPIEKELFEQYKALGDYAMGKTIDEVIGMPTYEKNEDYPMIPDVEDLKASVTIDVSSLLYALEDAKSELG